MSELAAGVETRTLDVPGAKIRYEVRGSGPALLCIPGGPADAGAFSKLAQELASNYTVVTRYRAPRFFPTRTRTGGR